MKKLFLIKLSFLLYVSSCVNCLDCQPLRVAIYFVKNDYGQDVTLYFYDKEGKKTKLSIGKNERVLVEKGSRERNFHVLRKSIFHFFNMIEVYNSSSDLIYTFKKDENCDNTNNVLCQGNYSETKEYTGDNGNVYFEYELTIK